MHPYKNNPKSSLWLNASGTPLSPAMANKRLKGVARKAGFHQSKISLHSLRHSRASELANILNEFQLCKLFGWEIGSNMPRTYIREQNIDVRSKIRAARGEIEEKVQKPSGKVCLSCEHQNALDAQYCDNCTLPLDRSRLEVLKKNADNERLLRSLVEEKWGTLIDQLKAEMKKTTQKEN